MLNHPTDHPGSVDFLIPNLRHYGGKHYVPANADLQHKFRQLADYYDVGPTSVGQADRHFMAAALHYFGGEANSARKQIHQSLKYGDSTASSENLRRIIGDREVHHGSADNEYHSSGDY